jgi:hypothetical protein
MGNRFTGFVRSEYNALPIDYYQAALAAKEQEGMSKLADMRQMLDYTAGVESVYNPDTELKQQHLSDMESKIAEIGKMNLRTPDALAKLQAVIGDRRVINDFVGIQRNTANYRTAMDNAKKYREQYGNDINIDPMMAAMQEYNSKGRDGFQAGFLSDSSISSFVDVNKGVQEVLEKMKPVKTEKVTPTGEWIYKVGNSELTMDQLVANAKLQLRDPKYATQLGLTNNYNLRRYGNGDTKAGAANYRDMNVQALTEKAAQLQQARLGYKPGSKEYVEIGKALEATQAKAKQMADLEGNALMRFAGEAMQDDLTLMAAAPFVQSEHTEDMKENPYALMRLKYGLMDANDARKQARKSAYDKEAIKYGLTIQDEINTVHATPISIPLVVDGKKTEQNMVNFDSMGGFVMEKMTQTISSLLKNTPQISDQFGKQFGEGGDKIQVTVPDKDGKPVQTTLQKAVEAGAAQIGYLPGTKEYYIQTDSGNYRVKSDLNMQRAMDNVYRMYDTNTPISQAAPDRVALSFDGKTQSPAFIWKERTDKGFEPKIFQQLHEGFDANGLTPKQFAQITNIPFSTNLAKNANNGFYVALEYDAKEQAAGLNSTMRLKRFMPYDEYKKLKDEGVITDNNSTSSVWSVQSGKMIPVEERGAGLQGDNIISKQLEFETQRGGILENIKKKMDKTKQSVNASMSVSRPSLNEDDDD